MNLGSYKTSSHLDESNWPWKNLMNWPSLISTQSLSRSSLSVCSVQWPLWGLRHVSAASSAPNVPVCVRKHVGSVSVMIQFTLKFTSSPGREVRTLPLVNRDPGAASHHSSRLSPHLLAFCYDCLCWCKQTPGGRDNKTLRPRFVCVSKQIFITDFFKPNKTKSQEPDCWSILNYHFYPTISHKAKHPALNLSLGNWYFC